MTYKSIITAMTVVGLSLTHLSCGGGKRQIASEPAVYQSPAPEFNADSAYSYVAAQCAFGGRTMNSDAHKVCGDFLVEKFKGYGLTVTEQTADSKLYNGTPIQIRNIIAAYNPQNTQRVMICAHWDTRAWADQDKDEKNHRTAIDGANDGASGVGVMIEIARQLQLKAPNIGVDLICFDAEDSGVASFDDYAGDSDATWCLGSRHWAQQSRYQGYSARFGILLDMVGGANTVFRKEGFSMHYAPQIVDKVWAAAYRIGMTDHFKGEQGGYITDDHRPVNELARIPCIDIIGSDTNNGGFPATWHTMNDNMKHISRDALKAVGQTVLEVIYNE